MWPFTRSPLRDVARRQLTLFAEDHDDLVVAARDALAQASSDPDPQSSQEHYGTYDILAEGVEDALDACFSAYASTLEEPNLSRYRRAFAREARRAYGDLLPRLTFDPPEDQLPG